MSYLADRGGLACFNLEGVALKVWWQLGVVGQCLLRNPVYQGDSHTYSQQLFITQPSVFNNSAGALTVAGKRSQSSAFKVCLCFVRAHSLSVIADKSTSAITTAAPTRWPGVW